MFERLHSGYYVLLCLALVEFSLAFVIGNADISSYTTTSGWRTMLVPMGTLFPLAWAGALSVQLARRRVDRPLIALSRMARRNRRWLLRGSFFVIVVLLLARSFSSYKAAIPEINPYWADPWLADLDRAVFGTDAWRLTHSLIGPFGTMLIDRVYALWFMVMMIFLGWFCFTRNAKLQLRGLLSYLFCWALLGNIVATVMSSVGPCFYDRFVGGARFSPMLDQLHRINEQHPLMAMGAMRYLGSTIGQDRVGGGISAMPSLHVTIATLCFLVSLTYSTSRLLKLATGLFAATIYIGSVHLGWHYASDGLVGIVAVTLIWWATGRYVDYLDARDRARQPAGAVKLLPATA